MTNARLASEELLELVTAERLKLCGDPEFAKLPRDEQLLQANRVVMARDPKLARQWQHENDDLARLGSRERLAMSRRAAEE